MFPSRDFFSKISTHLAPDEHPHVPLVLVPGQWGHKQAEKSAHLIWMKDSTPSSSGLPLPGVPLLGSLCLEETNTGFADLGEL